MAGASRLYKSDKDKFLAEQDTSWADDAGGVVPYYPSQRYLKDNLAPEKNITMRQISALALANQEALKNKLMSENMANKMLPTLLTEGASGIRAWGYPDTKPYRDILTKAGLPPTIEEANKIEHSNDWEREIHQAKLMHAVMAAKAKEYGEDLAIERWNGQGKTYLADAENHARKVGELEEMLQHPANKQLMDAWKSQNLLHSGGQDATVQAQPAEVHWEDKVPMWNLFRQPVKIVREALPDMPDNMVQSVQNKIRSMTAPSVPETQVIQKKKGGAVNSIDKPLKGGKKSI